MVRICPTPLPRRPGPGTGKTALCQRLGVVLGAECFTRQLSRFSTPDEIFGPLSMAALREDRHERNVQGYLPTAR